MSCNYRYNHVSLRALHIQWFSVIHAFEGNLDLGINQIRVVDYKSNNYLEIATAL